MTHKKSHQFPDGVFVPVVRHRNKSNSDKEYLTMKADESKALIERVGGLEAARFIVRDSPEDAGYVGFGCMYYKKSLDTTALMHCMAGQWINDCAYLNDELDSLPRFIKLSDLRTAIEQRPHPCATCPNVGHKACCCEVA